MHTQMHGLDLRMPNQIGERIGTLYCSTESKSLSVTRENKNAQKDVETITHHAVIKLTLLSMLRVLHVCPSVPGAHIKCTGCINEVLINSNSWGFPLLP